MDYDKNKRLIWLIFTIDFTEFKNRMLLGKIFSIIFVLIVQLQIILLTFTVTKKQVTSSWLPLLKCNDYLFSLLSSLSSKILYNLNLKQTPAEVNETADQSIYFILSISIIYHIILVCM